MIFESIRCNLCIFHKRSPQNVRIVTKKIDISWDVDDADRYESMNNLASFLLPAFLGLFAGVGHGIISHYAGLPISLTDQFAEILFYDDSLAE